MPYDVTLPQRTGVLPKTLTSDPTYIGDVAPDYVIGSGVVGITGVSVPADAVPYWSGTELSTPGVKFLFEADSKYLTPGLLALADLYAKDANASIASFLNLVSYFIPFFMSAFVIVILVYFLPATVRENKHMQTKRAMLLYLPVFVVSRIRSIRDLIKEIVANESSVAVVKRDDIKDGSA